MEIKVRERRIVCLGCMPASHDTTRFSVELNTSPHFVKSLVLRRVSAQACGNGSDLWAIWFAKSGHKDEFQRLVRT